MAHTLHFPAPSPLSLYSPPVSPRSPPRFLPQFFKHPNASQASKPRDVSQGGRPHPNQIDTSHYQDSSNELCLSPSDQGVWDHVGVELERFRQLWWAQNTPGSGAGAASRTPRTSGGLASLPVGSPARTAGAADHLRIPARISTKNLNAGGGAATAPSGASLFVPSFAAAAAGSTPAAAAAEKLQGQGR